MKQILFTFAIAAMSFAVSCNDVPGQGEEKPAVNLPADAGAITGETTLEEGGFIELTIAEIENAETYQWYKDGAKSQNTAERTLTVTEAGTYKVAGVNSAGEGKASADHVVTIVDNTINLDKATAIYFGDYYEVGAANWTLDISTSDDSKGISFNLIMEQGYTFADGVLQQGTYVLATQSVGEEVPSFLPGGLGGGYIYPTFAYEKNAAGEVTSGWFPTGGTFTITQSGDGYLITTDIEAIDARTDKPVENLKYRFEGVPTLQDQSPPPVEENTFVINNWRGGETEFRGTYPTGADNYYTFLFQEGLTNNGGIITGGSGGQLVLDFYSEPTSGYIKEGTYVLNGSTNSFTIDPGYTKFYMYEDGIILKSYLAESGKVNITARDGDNYTMEIDILFKDGSKLKGTFKARIELKG